MIEFDPAKDAANIKKHGISLARVADLVPAASIVDDRFDYGETRIRTYATSTASLTASPSQRGATSCVRSAFAAPTQRR
jgi:uncharacterized DUF497 family protein